jgi:hypothetical protein
VELAEAAPRLWRASFACLSRNELVIAWWSEDQAMQLRLPDAAPAGRWTTSLFQSPPARPAVSIGRLPVYWALPLDTVGRQPAFLREIVCRACSARFPADAESPFAGTAADPHPSSSPSPGSPNAR